MNATTHIALWCASYTGKKSGERESMQKNLYFSWFPFVCWLVDAKSNRDYFIHMEYGILRTFGRFDRTNTVAQSTVSFKSYIIIIYKCFEMNVRKKFRSIHIFIYFSRVSRSVQVYLSSGSIHWCEQRMKWNSECYGHNWTGLEVNYLPMCTFNTSKSVWWFLYFLADLKWIRFTRLAVSLKWVCLRCGRKAFLNSIVLSRQYKKLKHMKFLNRRKFSN